VHRLRLLPEGLSRGAISQVEGKASVDMSVALAVESVSRLPGEGIDFDWAGSIQPFVERMTEYAYGVASA